MSALLSAMVGIVGIVAWTNVQAAMNNTNGLWDANVQNLSITMPDPIGP